MSRAMVAALRRSRARGCATTPEGDAGPKHGERWLHKKTKRVARIVLEPHPRVGTPSEIRIEYQYERPLRTVSPWQPRPGTIPFVRTVAVRLDRFLRTFRRVEEQR